MRSLLSAAKVAYAELTKEERENSEIGGKLVKDMNDLNEELLQAEKEYGTHTRNVGNYAGALTDLKAEIKSLKGEMAGLDAGSEEYQKLANRAGELNDKLKEVNENTKANTGGTGFEKMSNNLGLVKDDLMNLDFAGVSEKMKQMAVISKSMTFSEVLGGLKNMGSALLSLGKAILTNPLFLMVGVIAGVGYALKVFSDSVKEDAIRAQEAYTSSIRENINALKQQAEYSKDYSDLFIRRAELEGKSVKEIGKMKLDAFKDEHKRKLELDKEWFTRENDVEL
jgi:chromosome segregation ATPase